MLTYGLDIGGTNVRGSAVDGDGNVLAERWWETADTKAELTAALRAVFRELQAVRPGGVAVGVGIAGLVDESGVVTYAPNIPALRDVPLRTLVERATGLPAVVDNDANVAAYGEARYGAAQGLRAGLVITLGTGVGGGILVDGRVYRGAHGFAAEVGHFTVLPGGPRCACGELGHWEAMASGTALGRMARERVAAGGLPAVLAAAGGDAEAVVGEMVGAAARAGDAEARALLAEYAGWVALGLAGLANILDPERIVVSGGLVTLGDLLFTPLREGVGRHLEGARYRPDVDVVPAALGTRSGMIGAAAMAGDLVEAR